MKARIIDKSEAGRWEDYVEFSTRTVAWQSYRWAEAVGRVFPVEFYPMIAEADGAIRGVLPLYRLSDRGASARLFSVPFAVAGGLTAEDSEAARALLDGAIDLADRLSASCITFKQYKHAIPGALKADTSYFNRELDLRAGTDVIWRQLGETNRRAVEAAERDELKLEYPSDQSEVFYEMLLGSMTRSGIPCPSKQWIGTLLELGIYKIALLERNGRLESGTMIKTFRDTVSFPLTCMRRRTRGGFESTYALYWALLQRFAGEGCRIFHSGRMPESEDVEVYRLGWGGEKFPYHYQYYPDSEARTESTNKRGWKRIVMQRCWKYLPLSVAGSVGPRIVARFP